MIARAPPKRVLISAFACSPLRGSEDGIGWHWVLETARLGYDVTVLTRRCYEPEIEAAIDTVRAAGKVRFVYLDLAAWINFHGLRKLAGYFYIYVWQIHALVVARRLQSRQGFDFVHHITFGGIRFPTFLGSLGIPLIFGPLGGGEAAPLRLRRGYPLRGKLVDRLRDLSNWLVRYDPSMHYSFNRAAAIVLRTPESIPVVPSRYRNKILLERDIGIDCGPDVPRRRMPNPETPRVLYMGRNLYWKGMHLGLPAFARLVSACPGARLSIVGSGPERGEWQRLAEKLGITANVQWVDWVDNSKVGEIYGQHDLFLFPSLHDAGATVIYEAASHRLPIVCLDLGASGVLVEPSFGIKVEVSGKDETRVIADLAEAMHGLATNQEVMIRLGSNARDWAERQTWASRVRSVYRALDGQLDQPPGSVRRVETGAAE